MLSISKTDLAKSEGFLNHGFFVTSLSAEVYGGTQYIVRRRCVAFARFDFIFSSMTIEFCEELQRRLLKMTTGECAFTLFIQEDMAARL